eukprot:scaffold131288_cov18-Tisochrysis_lutea.AAC.4
MFILVQVLDWKIQVQKQLQKAQTLEKHQKNPIKTKHLCIKTSHYLHQHALSSFHLFSAVIYDSKAYTATGSPSRVYSCMPLANCIAFLKPCRIHVESTARKFKSASQELNYSTPTPTSIDYEKRWHWELAHLATKSKEQDTAVPSFWQRKQHAI